MMERILEKTRLEGECRIFIGATNRKGYGRIGYKGKNELVHRVVAHLILGLDLNDHSQQALHKTECKSRACCAVEHLYVGTAFQNVRDTRVKRRIMT